MNKESMFAALAPKRKEISIKEFKFYARPMTVSEFQEHMSNPNKKERDAIMIKNCIVDESGNQIFDSVDEVKALYTNVQMELAQASADMAIFIEPRELEKQLK
ncbi:cytochrome [Serratia sp. JSRIV001]|uniref:phage tail assembly chaperone family protein, TAC n=1 Tax=Serratia TaxID=613 RepID=UPI001CBE2AA8|nr:MULTISPECIES: phage tail assembly chaperone family protein, TAC [Serratia]UAN44277.1 cytochrome [Serratia sp. JSRIV001]CAI0911806.1 Uncharacterised protein [Serratia quinivorans]CAI2096181.1 Uncharacterised protein [Serratia quinivorans]